MYKNNVSFVTAKEHSICLSFNIRGEGFIKNLTIIGKRKRKPEKHLTTYLLVIRSKVVFYGIYGCY